MPTVLRHEGYRFFFYSLESGEPPHVHVEHGENVAKYWLDPVALANSAGFRAHELKRVRLLVVQHQTALLDRWNEHFSHKG